MAGIYHDPFSDIQNIRELLKGYAPGFAFLKELLQNADDAEASTLRLAWHPGIARSSHPLLRAPALIALNDGTFTESDRQSLMQMGLGNKGGNQNKIGKFGLGTKSIFHVAEAFFFLESEGNTELRQILNPWSKRRHHDWDKVNETDWDLLVSEANRFGTDLSRWFTLWIPLRRKQDLNGAEPIVTGEHAYPGDANSCPESLKKPLYQYSPSLGELLPLLRHLRHVEFYERDKQLYQFHLHPEAETRDGTIDLGSETYNYRISSYDAPHRTGDWIKRSSWPTVFRTNPNGTHENSPDKAQWSHSVVLTTRSTKASTGYLRIYWSVFLPVGNKPYVEIPLTGTSRDVSIFLHGFFFLDNARTQIDGQSEKFPDQFPIDPPTTCRSWNRELACDKDGLLANVLPRLIDWSLIQEDITAIASAIYRSELWSSFNVSLCQKGTLIFCYQRGKWKWRWMNKDLPVRLLPTVTNLEDLNLLQSLTERPLQGHSIALTVDFPERPALSSKRIESLDKGGLQQLSFFIGRKAEALNEEEARLLREIINEASDEGLPPEWEDIPLFRVKYGGKDSWSRITFRSLRELNERQSLFRNDEHRLATELARATDMPQGVAIVDRGIPNCLKNTDLTPTEAASWILRQTTIADNPKDRIPLARKLARHESIQTVEIRAIRFLAHGSNEQKNESTKTLYYRCGGALGQHWNEAFEAILVSSSERWRLIDHGFAAELGEETLKRSNMRECSRDNWRHFVDQMGPKASETDFSNVPSIVPQWILKETPEEDLECLRSLKIHRLGNGEMIAATDGEVWLQGEVDIPNQHDKDWKQLCENTRIIQRSPNPSTNTRQSKLFEPRILDASGALRLAAKSAEPHTHTKLILHLLSEIGTPRNDATDCLKSAKWLPLETEDAIPTWVSPNEILHLPEADAQLDQVLRRLPESHLLSSAALAQEIRESNAWKTIARSLLRQPKQVVEELSTLFMRRPSPYTLGFSGEINDEQLDCWLTITKECKDERCFPPRPLLAVIAQNEEWRPHALRLANDLARPFEGERVTCRYEWVLDFLKEQHASDGNEEKRQILVLLADYLRGSTECGAWNEIRQKGTVELLSKTVKWKPITELAPPCDGIQGTAQLHPQLARALSLNSSGAEAEVDDKESNTDNTTSNEESAEILGETLAPFLEKLPPKAVGILPSILGINDATEKLANQIMDGNLAESVREELIPKDQEANDQNGGLLRERCKMWSFRLKRIKGSLVPMESVAGSMFEAPILTSADSMFLPDPHGALIRWKTGGIHQLLVGDAGRMKDLDENDLREVLLQSIRTVFVKAYHFLPPNLDSVYDKFAQLGQMSLNVAREEILMSADTILQSLAGRPSALEEVRTQLNNALNCKAQAKAGVGDVDRLKADGAKKEDQAHRRLQEILDCDTETHRDLVSALSRRIQQQQYEMDSIPFELLQNADDAATELIKAEGSNRSPNPMVTKFLMRSNEEGLRFIYGGRPINDACGQSPPKAESWRRDLLKMLLLNGSDKNPNEESDVTGKFGLGFKSVFLFSSNPRIISGRLSFEIVGGIWPRPLPDEDVQNLNFEADEAYGSWAQRTCIALTGDATNQKKVISTFKELAPWLPVFSQSLTKIVTEIDDQKLEFSWSPKRAEHSDQLRIGTIEYAGTSRRHIEITTGKIQWLFMLQPDGLSALPLNIPCLWVTTPTREFGHGFILNGPFSLDPGRTKLSKQDEDETGNNRSLFRQAADLWFDEFSKLAEHPSTLSAEFNIGDESSFWKSVWKLLTARSKTGDPAKPNERDNIAEALWSDFPGSGYLGLITKYKVIPQDLPAPLGGLTSLKTLKWSLSDWLAGENGTSALAKLNEHDLLNSIEPETFCSERVAYQLRNRCGFKIDRLNLPALLKKLANDDGHLKPLPCDIVSTGLFPEQDELSNDRDQPLAPQERDDLKALSKHLRFKTEANTWEVPERLVLGPHHDAEKDEGLRSVFAPPSRVLSKDYSKESALSILELRTRLNADAEELAKWIREAESEYHLREGLNYLAKGELRQETAFNLGFTWLQDIQSNKAYVQLEESLQEAIQLVFGMAKSENDRRRLLGSPGWYEPESLSYSGRDQQRTIDAEDILEAWDVKQALESFTISGPLGKLIVENAGNDVEITNQLMEPDSLNGKAAWYRLLCLGCTLGLPLGRRAIDRVINLWTRELGANFWQRTIPPSLDQDTDFNKSLNEFFDDKIHKLFKDQNASGEDAQFWRRVFYDFRKMHHFVFQNDLPETVLEFTKYERVDASALVHFVKTGHVPDFMRDPSTSQFRGVIGQSMTASLLFVMRELCRLKIIDRRFASTCYYMNSPARRVASWLDWLDGAPETSQSFSSLLEHSETVHERMKEELPELVTYFDLPLQLFGARNI